MTDFDYKKYSLEKLEDWVHDALSGDATPQEIYDTIKNVVVESRCYHKQQGSRAYELLALLNGNGQSYEDVITEKEYYESSMTEEELSKYKVLLSCDKDDPSPECKGAWNSFWEDVDEKHSREYNLREAEYYNQRAKLDAEYEAIKAAGGYEWTPLPPVEGKKSKHYYEYDRNDPNRENPFKDRVVKWVLPVQQVKNWVLPPGTKPGSDVDYILEEDYVVNLPDDLLEAANLKEGDTVEWVDNGDGSYLLKKV